MSGSGTGTKARASSPTPSTNENFSTDMTVFFDGIFAEQIRYETTLINAIVTRVTDKTESGYYREKGEVEMQLSDVSNPVRRDTIVLSDLSTWIVKDELGRSDLTVSVEIEKDERPVL